MKNESLEEKLREKYAQEIEVKFHSLWKSDNGPANVENYIIDLLVKELTKKI